MTWAAAIFAVACWGMFVLWLCRLSNRDAYYRGWNDAVIAHHMEPQFTRKD